MPIVAIMTSLPCVVPINVSPLGSIQNYCNGGLCNDCGRVELMSEDAVICGRYLVTIALDTGRHARSTDLLWMSWIALKLTSHRY